MKHFAIISILTTILLIGCNNNESKKPIVKVVDSKQETQIDTAGISLSHIENLHERKTLKPRDRSLFEYINSNYNKPDSLKKVIYLLPFGNMKPEVEEIIKDELRYLEAFFQLPVKLLNRVPYEQIDNIDSIKTRMVSANDYSYYSKMKGEIRNLREQIQATSFMDNYLIKNKPKDAIAVLGITEHDIYNPKYNYLFGSSKLNDGVGVVSTFRLISYRDFTRENIRKVTSKQIVNLFSIKNVKDYNCLLNFHQDKNELERGEFKLSPKALQKLKYSIGFDYNKRFKDLQYFWAKEDNKMMVAYYKKCQK